MQLNPLPPTNPTNPTNPYVATYSQRGYLSKNMQWKKGDERSQLCLTIADTSIAIWDESSKKSFYQRIKSHITHIKLQGEIPGYSGPIFLNIFSLSDRTHTSVARILWASMRGKVDTKYVSRRIKKRDAAKEGFFLKNLVIPEVKSAPFGEQKKILDEGQHILKRMRMAASEKGDVFERWPLGKSSMLITKNEGVVTVLQDADLLWKDAYSGVSALKDIYSGQADLIKKEARLGYGDRKLYEAGNKLIRKIKGTEKAEAKKIKEAFTNEASKKLAEAENLLKREVETLRDLNKCDLPIQKPFPGIPSAPLFYHQSSPESDFTQKSYYISKRPDFDLTSRAFLKLSFEKRLKAAGDLIKGVGRMHALGYVHQNIEPAHCHSMGGKLQLAHLDKAQKKQELGEDSFESAKKEDVRALGLTLLSILSGKSIESTIEAYKRKPAYPGQLEASVKEAAMNELLYLVGKKDPQVSILVKGMLNPSSERASIDEAMRVFNTESTNFDN